MKLHQCIQKIIFNKCLLAILVILCTSNLINAQEVKIEANANKTNILIGDHISFTNELVFNPQKFRVEIPRIADTFNHFELIERKKIDTSHQQDFIKLTQENIISHFDSGLWFIPSQQFVVTPLDGSTPYEILSDSIGIMVNTIDADTSKPIKPIFEIIAAEKPWWEIWLYVGAILIGLLLIIALIYYLIKRYRKKAKNPREIKKVHIAPWDAAINSLETLTNKELWLNEKEKQHHTRLTDIVRTYIEDAFGLDCFEKTSQEIVTDVKKSLQKKRYKKRGEELEKLRNIFLTADLVKFAKSKPTEYEHQQSNDDTKSFIKSTSLFLQAELKKESNKPTK